jgi:hypothetical protein
LQERIEQLQGAQIESDETQPAPEDSEADEKKKPVR